MITPQIFRAYDIRGIFEKDFDLEGAEKIGKGYGTYLIRTSEDIDAPLNVCVGRDGRIHGEEIQKAFVKGLLSTGIKITDIGLSFSPLVYFSICNGFFDGGVSITASHNPKEYNGFKLQRGDAHPICGEEIQEILKIIETEDFIESKETFEIEEKSFWEDYKKKIFDISHTPQKGKIVIDSGNGITGMFAPEIFRIFGYEVIELYCEVDGNFPNHDADPENKENLEDLKDKVIKEQAQFGVAFDGDGDRVGIVDNEGRIYHADELLIILINDALKRNKNVSVVYTVTASGLIKEEIERLGGKAIESKVGHSFVEEKMREENAIIGGESSGHFFFAENYYGYDDAILASIKILEIVVSSGVSMKNHISNLPKIFTSPEIKVEVDDNKKFQLIEKIKKRFINKYPCNTLDGIKIDFGDKSWAVCRASNTSPKISFRVEARDNKTVKELMVKINQAIEEEKKNLPESIE